MAGRVVVAGVGMIPFATPRKSEPYDLMGEVAAKRALEDSGIEYSQVRQAYVGYSYGDSTSGQKVLYRLGQTGIPIVNVNNNCSTGSTALFLARQAIENGAGCVIALGFEQMTPGALAPAWTDRPSPLGPFDARTRELQGWDDQTPMAAQYFGGAGASYADKYGLDPAVFAKIS